MEFHRGRFILAWMRELHENRLSYLKQSLMAKDAKQPRQSDQKPPPKGGQNQHPRKRRKSELVATPTGQHQPIGMSNAQTTKPHLPETANRPPHRRFMLTWIPDGSINDGSASLPFMHKTNRECPVSRGPEDCYSFKNKRCP